MMTSIPPASPLEQVSQMLKPWHAAMAAPAQAQEGVLQWLLGIYAQTEYGRSHRADKIGSISEYQQAFPVSTYADYKPLLDQVMAGETSRLLNEPPIAWAITRGTTGDTKFIPLTPTDMRQRASAGRAMLNYVAATKRFDLFEGVNLNLNFPSQVGVLKVGEREVAYGYSSGIYAKYVSTMTPIRSVPAQEEIDALDCGRTVREWHARFDLAYQKCQGLNVSLVGGVAPTALDFARYLHQQYRVYPKAVWRIQIMTLGSVPGINTRLEPAIKAMFGPVVIREIYGSTEGMLGQQLDEKRAWTPNYDLFFFEVETPSGVKPLHQLQPGELGSLVISTPVLPRYRIGDLVLAFEPPYFRCIGRQARWTRLRYWWHEFQTGNFGRL
jgi:hypothetical protein